MKPVKDLERAKREARLYTNDARMAWQASVDDFHLLLEEPDIGLLYEERESNQQ